jgi:hypothetical protein
MAVEIGMPEVPHFGMNVGCMVNQISWSMQRSGLVTATVGLIGQGEAIATASAAGALNSLELSRFGSFHGSVEREGATLGNPWGQELQIRQRNVPLPHSFEAPPVKSGQTPGLEPGGEDCIFTLMNWHQSFVPRRQWAAETVKKGPDTLLKMYPAPLRGFTA